MTRYEGLNLPQLLELMHGLVMPEPVSWLPRTVGWWVLLVWLTVVVVLMTIRLVQRYRRNRYRREATVALVAIAVNADRNPAAAAEEIAVLLKRTALAAYPREQVASLYGSAWAEFIVASAGNDPVVEAAASELAHAAYNAAADGRTLMKPARRWIKVHRA